MSMQEGDNGNKKSDEKVRVVRVAGMLFIGFEDENRCLTKPRMIQFVQMKDGSQGMTFSEMPGMADVLEVNEAMTDLAYYPTDEGFINAYRQAVTGLALVKALPPDIGNVVSMVSMHGRPN